MDQLRIRETALALQQALAQYAPQSEEARSLAIAIQPFLEKALAGQIVTPLEERRIPGDYAFTEGAYEQYPELSKAYASFSIQITGGYTPDRQKIIAIIEAQRAKSAEQK